MTDDYSDHVDGDVLASGEDGPVVERASIRRNLAQMTSSQLVSWVLATVTSVVVPRYLGPSTLGELGVAKSVWAIAAVFTSLGTALYLQLEISRDQRAGLRLIAPVLAARTLAFVLAASLIAGYVAVFDVDATVAVLLVILGFSALLTLWEEVFGTTFMGLETMSTVAVLSVSFKLLSLMATVAVLVLGFGVFGVVGVSLAMGTLSLSAFIWRFRRIAQVDWTGARARVWTVARRGMPFMVVAIALVLYRQIDIIVISAVAGSRDLGWYSAADTLFGSLMFPTTVIVATIFPTLGRLYAHDRQELRALVERSFSMLLVATVPIGLGALAVGPTFASLLFGDKFSGTATLLMIFGPLTVLTFGTTFLSAVAVASERQRLVATLLFASAAMTVPLDLILVPWAADRYDNGAIGGALAFVATETFQFAVGLAVIAPYLVTWRWGAKVLRILAAGGVMTAAVWPLREVFVLVPAAVGAVVYGIAVIVFGLLDADQKAIVGGIAARGGVSTPWGPDDDS